MLGSNLFWVYFCRIVIRNGHHICYIAVDVVVVTVCGHEIDILYSLMGFLVYLVVGFWCIEFLNLIVV